MNEQNIESEISTSSSNSSDYSKRPVWQWLLIYLVVGGAVYGLIYYLSSQGKMTSGYTESSGGSSENQQVDAMAQPDRTINVTLNEFSFDPATIVVNANEKVSIIFKNMGKYPHDFQIPDLDVKTKVVPTGGTDTITFTASKTGKFDFICTLPNHAEKGMVGTLQVN